MVAPCAPTLGNNYGYDHMYDFVNMIFWYRHRGLDHLSYLYVYRADLCGPEDQYPRTRLSEEANLEDGQIQR